MRIWLYVAIFMWVTGISAVLSFVSGNWQAGAWALIAICWALISLYMSHQALKDRNDD